MSDQSRVPTSLAVLMGICTAGMAACLVGILVALLAGGCGDEKPTNRDVAESLAASFCGMLDKCESPFEDCVNYLVRNYCRDADCSAPNLAPPEKLDGCITLIEAVDCNASAPNLCIPGLVYYNCPAVDATPACDGILE